MLAYSTAKYSESHWIRQTKWRRRKEDNENMKSRTAGKGAEKSNKNSTRTEKFSL